MRRKVRERGFRGVLVGVRNKENKKKGLAKTQRRKGWFGLRNKESKKRVSQRRRGAKVGFVAYKFGKVI